VIKAVGPRGLAALTGRVRSDDRPHVERLRDAIDSTPPGHYPVLLLDDSGDPPVLRAILVPDRN
jgi:hypothetical protein